MSVPASRQGVGSPVEDCALSSRRRLASLGLVVLCASLTAFALIAAPASADRSYDSQITGFSNPWGVTVDPADNVWVSDPGNGGAISEYNAYPSQTLLGTQTGNGHYEATYIRSLAVDGINGYLYVADSGPVDVHVFDNTGIFSHDISHNFGGGYVFVAADNSGDASNGDIYVASTCCSVQKFDAGGNPVNFSGSASYISENNISGTPGGSFGQVWNIATDNNGNIYVVDQGKSVVDEFHSNGEFVQEFTGAAAPGGFSGNLTGVAVDPTNDNVLVVDSGNNVVDEFDSSGAYLDQITGPSPETPFGGLNAGIAVNSNGYVYVADGGDHVVDIFTPNAILPKVTYGAVTNQTQTSGTLNASVDLNEGGDVSACTFQYGPTTAYGSSVPCSPATPYSSNTSVSANLSGLTTETPYHYRILLTNPNGTKKGQDQVFLPHAVAGLTTNPATNVARNCATFNGSFNGNGEDTHYHFEWGTDGSYGQSTPSENAGPVSGPQNESFELCGLVVETTYHYRIAASNAVGDSNGADQSFKTLAAVENLSTEPASDITATGATLNASYTGIGEDVHYYFEWGLEASYGNKTPIPPGTDAGSPSGPQSLSFELSQLQVNTVYHYRVVASDAAGTTFGPDQSFNTLGPYQFTTDYGSAGSGDGQLTDPLDVAVDNSNGDVYVADTGNHRIVKLDSSGHFLAVWGWGVGDGNAAAEVCTSGCQVGIPGSGAGQFTDPKFVEVDNSGGPSNGDVYVADTTDDVVQKFDPSGNLVTSWGTGGVTSYSGEIGGVAVDAAGSLIVQPGSGTGIAVDSFGHVFTGQTGIAIDTSTNDQYSDGGTFIQASNAGGTPFDTMGSGNLHAAAGLAIDQSTGTIYAANSGDDNIAVFSLLPAPEVVTGPVTNRGPTSGTLTGHVDPAGAGQIVDCYFEYGSDATYGLGSVPCSPATPLSGSTDVSANLTGLTPFATYHYRLVAIRADGKGFPHYGLDQTFTPAPTSPPEVDATSSSNLTPTTASLNAQVNPNLAPTIYRFQYGTDTSYGSQTLAGESIGSDGVDHAVSNAILGLQPGTTYHFRVVAINFNGSTTGPDQTFTTPDLPAVADANASEITATAATLGASVRPGFRSTTYHFEYGLTGAYGSTTPESASIGSDDAVYPARAVITGIQPSTTYHYRIVATNAIGATTGPDQTFTTASGARTVTPPPACKAGFVKKQAKCVKKQHKRKQRKHHKRSRSHG